MLNDIGMISDEAIIRAFGERLRIARLKKGMTQEELGESIGIDKSRISDYAIGDAASRRCIAWPKPSIHPSVSFLTGRKAKK